MPAKGPVARDEHPPIPENTAPAQATPGRGILEAHSSPSSQESAFIDLCNYLLEHSKERAAAFVEDIKKSPAVEKALSKPSSPAEPSSQQAGQSPNSSSQPHRSPSRTSSQAKALRYFKKELERYAAITSAAGKVANFTPTISPTPLSLHTVQELLPYREQFLAAGLAVTAQDQSPPKGKAVLPQPKHAQLDGKGQARQSSSSPSPVPSDETMIQFDERDSVDLALIDELPVRKIKEQKRVSKTRSILPWFRNRGKSGVSPQEHKEPEKQVAPGRPKAPTPPRKSSIRDKNHREAKAVGVSGPSGQKARGRVQPPPPDQPPPPVPLSKAPREMEIRLKHRTVFNRGPYDTAHDPPAQPKTSSPSHIRQRHTPLTHPVARKGLLEKLQEAEEITEEIPRQVISKALAQITQNPHKPPTDVRQVDKAQSDRPQLRKEHSFSPTPPEMVGRRESSTPRLPMTWQYAVGTPSSFEQALDDVVRKLDEMEEKPVIGQLEVTLKPLSRQEKAFSDRTNDAQDTQQLWPQTVEKSTQPPPTSVGEESKPADTQDQRSKSNSKVKSKETGTTSSSSFPDHRLQRASAMRRQRIAAEEEARRSKLTGDAARSTPAIPPPDVPLPDLPPPKAPSEDIPPPAERKQTQPGKKRASKIAKSLSEEDITVDHRDRDIDDRDVLKGLKLAISAACDENLDIWIRGRTGLRLRRFLADLKTFENIGAEDDGILGIKARKDKGRGKEVETRADDEWEEVDDDDRQESDGALSESKKTSGNGGGDPGSKDGEEKGQGVGSHETGNLKAREHPTGERKVQAQRDKYILNVES